MCRARACVARVLCVYRARAVRVRVCRAARVLCGACVTLRSCARRVRCVNHYVIEKTLVFRFSRRRMVESVVWEGGG